jgi:hypothetical protein
MINEVSNKSFFTPKRKEIVLTSGQQPVYEEFLSLYKKYPILINVGIMGSGKTPTALKLAEDYQWIVIICPNSAINVWRKELENYGFNMNYVIIIPFHTIAGEKTKDIEHNLLYKEEDEEEEFFFPTEEFIEMVNDGCYLIIDEFDWLKNKTPRYHACKALLDIIHESNNSSAMLQSGTPYDKECHVLATLHLISLIKDPVLYDYDEKNHRIHLRGVNELIKFCENVDEEKTKEVLYRNNMEPGNIEKICFLLYTQIVQKEIVRALPSPVLSVKLNCYNGYFHLSQQGQKRLRNAIEAFRSHIDKDDIGKKMNISLIEKEKQLSKVEIIVRVANIILQENIKDKVVITYDFDEPILETFLSLSHFPIKIVNGKVDLDERNKIIDEFNEDNDNLRVLIVNTQVGFCSINLDDRYGGRKRWCLSCPTYYVSRMHQLIRRFYRLTTKSDFTMIWIYGQCDIEETSLLNIMAKKSYVMKETSTLQVDEGHLFPGDYKKMIEKEFSRERLDMIECDDNFVTKEIKSQKRKERKTKILEQSFGQKQLVLRTSVEGGLFNF